MIAPDDLAACRESLRVGSRSFGLATLLLPRRLQADAASLYAFCRAADDAVDAAGADAAAAARGLAAVRRALDRAYAGTPSSAVERAFASTILRHRLPRALPEALLEGFAWDAEGRRYRDVDAVVDYAMRVAGSVGVMMALLMGERDRAMLAGAADLGCAMQLTNIARDVGEDARLGRIYLPLDRLAARGIDVEAFVARPEPLAGVRDVVGETLALSAEFYRRAEPAIARLPLACRPAIWAARLLYGAIGDEVARRAGDGVTARAVVSPARKLALAPRWLASLARAPGPVMPETAASGLLLEAAAWPHGSRSSARRSAPVALHVGNAARS